MKQAFVEGMFPDLRGGDIYKTGRGRGGSSRIAVARAFGDLLKQVSKKRITTIKATISITDVIEEDGQ